VLYRRQLCHVTQLSRIDQLIVNTIDRRGILN